MFVIVNCLKRTVKHKKGEIERDLKNVIKHRSRTESQIIEANTFIHTYVKIKSTQMAISRQLLICLFNSTMS